MSKDPLETPDWLNRAIDGVAGILFLLSFLILWICT